MALALSRFRDVFRSQASVQWASLLVISAVFVFMLELLRLPAALLLGPMLAGIGPLQSSFTELLASGFDFLRQLGGGR